ncbi:SDR family NAD(P)-dependent oxidoreductase [Dactylosporangium aurantiacum]|uniref:SDR family NAD(P)-dependent oxidoreductase n=1 Tax=Dactylosporangium aurantiacum TaxID=35754 RepID=A0A9Q9INE0_9ACTN|nr:SDR family NAD(P)-dependent oxidoreductase [Dactylosporangium aurantiacum]MDG6109005.1 SDR family NAD(P)-dependent oxidoreductase [Dactylosporangium aurantiacum]UWZ56494.1 SDR family NAD(P)-dependent oxidoreductase [Dactylosporangium aurantiacum]
MYRTELKGRVAVVLGGADGVGAAVCRLLAARGARIAVIGDDESELQDLVDELRWVGADAIGVVSAGVDPASVHAGVLDEVGPPDLLFVLPCTTSAGTDFRRRVDSGLTATFEALQAFVPRMAEARAGAVVTVAPFGTDAATSAVGGGVTALTQHVAREFAETGVRANVVSWTPAAERVEDVAFAAVYLASDASPTLTATTFDVAGTHSRL